MQFQISQGFDPFSAVACIVVFAAKPSEEEKKSLQEVSNDFFKGHAGGACRPRLILQFEDIGNDEKPRCKLTFRQRSDTNAPTRSCFQQLLQKLGFEEAKKDGSQPTPATLKSPTPTAVVA